MPTTSTISVRAQVGGNSAPPKGIGVGFDPQPLLREGPRMTCEVSVDEAFAAALLRAGKPIPQPKVGKILIDTGASTTCIRRDVLAEMGIVPHAEAQVKTPSGGETQGIYACSLAFPGSGLDMHLRVHALGANLDGQDIIGLLGRDILSKAVLIYNGSVGYWSLSF